MARAARRRGDPLGFLFSLVWTAALLALAERQPLTGQDLLHALILGVEIQCRVGNILCTPPAESAVGFSVQGLVGVIGAAVAAGKVLNLDETRMATAIGLAAEIRSRRWPLLRTRMTWPRRGAAH